MDSKQYDTGSEYFDEDGNVNYSRANENGRPRYHSDWCSLMYSRLVLARNLLSDTGAIFISIDETGTTRKMFHVPKDKHWVYEPETMKRLIEDNRIWWGKDGNSFPAVKQFLSDIGGRKTSSLLMYEDYGHTDRTKKDLIKLFPYLVKAPLDSPKPIKLVKMLAMLDSGEDDIVIDFFAGSATTAHSIFKLNAEKSSSKKFILVQLPEPLIDNLEANK